MNYRELHEIIMDLSETELRQMLEEERRSDRRRTFMIRLHQRLCALRAQREREEIERVCAANS
jgi:hypothetical protein